MNELAYSSAGEIRDCVMFIPSRTSEVKFTFHLVCAKKKKKKRKKAIFGKAEHCHAKVCGYSGSDWEIVQVMIRLIVFSCKTIRLLHV